ncbi:MAG: hypothetical protein EXS11_05105 [Gemmataceae bacterium]|nr:hypothetical protein [Gemmataceae bacterium]
MSRFPRVEWVLIPYRKMPVDFHIEQFSRVQKLYKEIGDHPQLDKVLDSFKTDMDQHLPKKLLLLTLRDVLIIPYEEMCSIRGVGFMRISRLLDLLERVAMSSCHPNDYVSEPTLEENFSRIQNILIDHGNHPVLDSDIYSLQNAMDKHISQRLRYLTIREVLKIPYKELLSLKGVGFVRIKRLVDLIDRVCRTITHPNETVTPVPPVLDFFSIEQINKKRLNREEVPNPERHWDRCGRLIREHGLSQEPLGKFVEKLMDISSTLWAKEVGFFTSLPREEVRFQSGIGDVKAGQIFGIIDRVVQALVPIPQNEFLIVIPITENIREVLNWVTRVLRLNTLPPIASIRTSFLLPLLNQIELDLGPEKALLVRQRIGLDEAPQTLEQLGNSTGVTRERIRQLLALVEEVFQIRWPEGQYLFQSVVERLLGLPNSQKHLDLLRTISDICFGVFVPQNSSKEDVLASWKHAARQHHTPMNGMEAKVWLANQFPHTRPYIGLTWLTEGGILLERKEREPLYFANEPTDLLLHYLMVNGDGIKSSETNQFFGDNPGNTHSKLNQDMRFILDDENRYHASIKKGVFRKEDVWHFELYDIKGLVKQHESVSISDLAHLIIGGLLQAGIADATVWGVFRYANNMVRKLYGASLPSILNPFNFTSIIIRQSNGLIRTMRRRRLRWDSSNGSVPVLGKNGWIKKVIKGLEKQPSLVEITLLMKEFYQDYKAHVFQQADLESLDDEEGAKPMTTTEAR